MIKFGKSPPRSLESFGVAGLLAEDCRVFYESLFDTRHLGRVSDLMSARLKESQPDELRLRALLLFGVFEGFLALATSGPVTEPITVECGIDGEKIAIGVAFSVGSDVPLDYKGLAKHLLRHAHRVVVRAHPKGKRVEIVSLLGLPGQIDEESLNSPPSIEVVVFDHPPAQAPEAAEYVELGDLNYPQLLREEKKGPATHHAQHPAEQSDAETVRTAAEAQPSTAETLIQAAIAEPEAVQTVTGPDHSRSSDKTVVSGKSDASDQGKVRVGGIKEAPNAKTTVKGVTDKTQDQTRIEVAGNEASAEDSAASVIGSSKPKPPANIRNRISSGVQAGAEPESDAAVSVVSSNASAGASAEVDAVVVAGSSADIVDRTKISVAGSAQVKAYQSQILALERKIKEMEDIASRNAARTAKNRVEGSSYQEDREVIYSRDSRESAKSSRSVEPSDSNELIVVTGEVTGETIQAASESAPPERSTGGLLKKIWPFRRKKTESAAAEADASAPKATSGSAPVQTGSEPTSFAISGDNIEVVSERLVSEIESGRLGMLVNRAQAEAAQLRTELANTRAKRWVDGLMGELVTERAHLNEIARQLNIRIRQKELDFRDKEQIYREDIRRRDGLIRSKTAANEQLKDQLANAMSQIDRLKNAKQNAPEESLFKQRVAVLQDHLATAREEYAVLQRKYDEARAGAVAAAVTAAQVGGGKRGGPTYDEMTELKGKYDRALRQAEEFKKANQLLMMRLDASKKDRGTSTVVVEDLKKKLEAAMNMANVSKRESERFSGRAEALQKEEMRLRIELGKALEEVKKLKTASKAQALQKPGFKNGSGGGSSQAA